MRNSMYSQLVLLRGFNNSVFLCSFIEVIFLEFCPFFKLIAAVYLNI